ncbi:glycine zipper 2TM domain-containing protein [Actimicrobium antarcticum]|uniref:Glycine zipper 2TM domain-containing protein n=1 Tax=Actimicrobium antarcticum TaxID=1051899 RepID=A0ABP7SJF4_9BURK
MKINKMSGRIHPLMAAAAVAVILVSLVGVAAITGVLPNSTAKQAEVVPVQTPLISQDTRQASANHQSAPVKHSTNKNTNNESNYDRNDNRNDNNYSDRQNQQAAAVCSNCGRVESVNAIQSAAQPSGVGVGVGAVLGGLLGNQVGGGNGRTLATVAGAVGGGYAGNEVEKRSRGTTTYQVRVRMEDGQIRTFPQNGPEGWRAGDRVRVVNGALTSRG